ncbi:MAG: ABC transporter permease [Chloroflexota bacterium]
MSATSSAAVETEALGPSDAPGIVAQLRGSSAFWIGVVVVGLVIVFGLITPNNAYIKPSNLFNIGLNASQIMLIAVGMTFLIGAGHLDLSVGYNLILASVLGAKVMVAVAGSTEQVAAGEYPNLIPAIVAGAIVAVVAGGAGGLLNGLLVTRLRLNSFIVTLATSGILYGAALILTSAANVPFVPDEIQLWFGSNRLFGQVPLPLLLTLVVCGVMWLVMRTSRFGMRTLALGSSREAAVRAGIDIDRHTVWLFVLQGLLVGLAAVIDLARNAGTNVRATSPTTSRPSRRWSSGHQPVRRHRVGGRDAPWVAGARDDGQWPRDHERPAVLSVGRGRGHPHHRRLPRPAPSIAHELRGGPWGQPGAGCTAA